MRYGSSISKGYTNNAPNAGASGCNASEMGMSVAVIALLVSVQPSWGFSDHNKYSANCIADHPINVKPSHWKCGIPELSKYTMATNDTVEVYKLDSLL
jgi:hypothetical protein